MFDFISVAEAAKITGLTESAIRLDLRNGVLRGEIVSGVWIVSRVAAEARRRKRAPKNLDKSVK